jgi:hypothetical protein
MDRYEYIISSIPRYIDRYTTKMMSMNIDGILMIVDTLGGIIFIAFPIGYFLAIRLTRRGEIESKYYFLTRNSRTIQSSSNVVLV